MLSTIAGASFVATLVSAYRNTRQWEEYNRGHLSRGQMTNKVFTTVVLGGATAAMVALNLVF